MSEEESGEVATVAEETPEDAYAGLEAKVKLLQDDNLSPAEIIKKIYEEDYETDTSALARILDMTVFDVGRVKSHVKRPSKKDARERLKKSESKIDVGKPGTVFKTDTDLNSILKEILETHPDINDRQILEIMSWAKMTPGGLQPAHLYALLSSMKGIDKNAASMLAQKYSLAIQKAQQEGGGQQFAFGPIPMSAPQPPQQQQQFIWPLAGTAQPWSQQPYHGQSPPGYFSQEQVNDLIEKRDQKRDLEDLKDTVASLREEIPKLIKENIPRDQAQGIEYEEEVIYLNDENKSVPKEQATHYKTIKRPISTRQSADFRALEGRIDSLQQFIQDKKVEALSNEIKELKEAKGQPAAEDSKITELKQAIADTKKELQETKDKITAEDKKRLEDKLGNLEGQISSLRTSLASSGVNSPEGVMASAITTFGSRKPGEKAIDTIRDILAPGAVAPVPQEAVPSGAGVLTKEADKLGLVTIVRDRRR